VVVAGSTSVQPVAELIAEHYEVQSPGSPVNVQGGGSTAGVKATLDGAADIGMISRELKSEETGLTKIAIARDAVAFIVHPTNPIAGLSSGQARAIYAGEATHWSELTGAPPGAAARRGDAITVITREEGSGTRSAFEEGVMEQTDLTPRALVQDSTGTVRAIVASDRNAIGYISLGMVTPEVRPMPFEGVTPTVEAVASGRYALARSFYFITKGEPDAAARAFIDYALGPDGQALVEAAGYIPIAGGGVQ
jgi:phosphate transport system substrate-binding protein